jgi:selenide,water dikinase
MSGEMTSVPILKELVLVGGGHAHALVLRRWGMRPVPGVRLTLVNPEPAAPYTGMLPGHVAGHYSREEMEIDLVRLARFAGARLILDRAVGLDPGARLLTMGSGRRIGYDIASVDVGITSDLPNLPGFAEHGRPAKPFGRFVPAWEALVADAGPVAVAVLGGGVAGAELAMAASHRMRRLGRSCGVTLIDRGKILDGIGPAARLHLIAALRAQGVELIAEDAPVEVTAASVRLASGREIPADMTIGAAGAMAQPWLAETGLATENGYLVVDRFLRSVSDPSVYAAGDCAHIAHAPRPKAGVYAVRAAPVLAHNLVADLTGRQRRPFRPQRDFLKLVSMGDRRAVAEKGGLALAGPWFWRQKDRIDRAFMEKLTRLPAMPSPRVPASAARGVAQEMSGPAPCGGCGAKLGSHALSGVIAGTAGAAREDAPRLPGDDAGLLKIGGQGQVISTDHLRAFALDPALVARVAAVHALGDVWAMGARPQAALATVILPRMAARLQGRWLEEVMEAAGEVFAGAGAAVLGGHSSMGSELTVGFTVTGLLDGAPVTLAGAEPGDGLILTKPVGTGALLAGEMRGLARGADVAAAWRAMAEPQGVAAEILGPRAHAMTDVTGFGLAGHLWNICAASGVGAEVRAEAVPLLPGAEDLAARGVRSTLFAQNRAALGPVFEGPAGARTDLMFDPQTAGGLLAAVPAEAARAVTEALAAQGRPAWEIGVVTDRPGLLRVV